MVALPRQRGELSLLWCALLFGLVALIAAIALFSMRSERNFFAEAWSRAMHSAAGHGAQQIQSATINMVKSGTVQAAEIRKCTVEGRLVYSNVECSAKRRPRSRKVDLYDSSGIEAPKAPPAIEADANAPLSGMSPGMQEKMIGKAAR